MILFGLVFKRFYFDFLYHRLELFTTLYRTKTRTQESTPLCNNNFFFFSKKGFNYTFKLHYGRGKKFIDFQTKNFQFSLLYISPYRFY